MSVTVTVRYDGADITDSVLFSTASFESQLSAIPGTCQLTCRDIHQELTFTTGRELQVLVDDTVVWGGFITMVSQQFAIAVDDTGSRPASEVQTRQWVLRGVDYNILFDKRVLRNPNGYTTQIPSFDQDRKAGDLIINELPKYLDLPDDLDLTTYVDEAFGTVSEFAYKDGMVAWQQQGTVWREVMTQWASFNGAIWYIDAAKRLHWKSIEDSHSDWGFSDVPNRRTPVAGGSPLATIGFRELSATEDGSFIINDALVWGGTVTASSGNVVFARAENTESITTYNRWQLAENHIGELGFGTQAHVQERADLIVTGSASGERDQLYGFKFPQWQFRFAWHDHNLPIVAGEKQYPAPGSLFPIVLYTFGESVTQPLIKELPLRSIHITFPELKDDGTAYVRYEGFFGIQTQDPWTLWKHLLLDKERVNRLALSSANNDSTSANYGAFGSFFPEESPDGVRTLFHVKFGYVGGTLNVVLNGSFQRPGVEFVETDPETGAFTFSSAPLVTDWIWVTCLCLAG